MPEPNSNGLPSNEQALSIVQTVFEITASPGETLPATMRVRLESVALDALSAFSALGEPDHRGSSAEARRSLVLRLREILALSAVARRTGASQEVAQAFDPLDIRVVEVLGKLRAAPPAKEHSNGVAPIEGESDDHRYHREDAVRKHRELMEDLRRMNAEQKSGRSGW